MRVNLLLNGDDVRSGFLNIDPMADTADGVTVPGSLSNLDEHVDDAEADEILATDIIDFLPTAVIVIALENWVRKVRHGGSIQVGGVDIMAVAKALTKRDIDISTANSLLYGRQSAPWEYRKSTMMMDTVIDYFRGRGLKIIHKILVDYKYLVKAERS